MSRYIENNLMKDEVVLYEAKVSKWSQVQLYLLGIIFLYFNGIGLIFFLVAYIRIATTELAITNKRVIAKFGFISRKAVELYLTKIESVKIDQSIIGRIFNYGSVGLGGTGGTMAPIPFIHNPLEFRKKFNEYNDKNNN